MLCGKVDLLLLDSPLIRKTAQLSKLSIKKKKNVPKRFTLRPF